MKELALFGGEPVLTEPLQSPVVIDEDERQFISEVMESREFSRFMGSSTDDIESLLKMPSSEAVDYKSQYFNFLGGRMVRRFEAEMADHFGSRFAISVNAATSGLSTALGAAGVGPGDEVITTCMSFNATAMSILIFNGIPVFVDVSPKNFCMEPKKVEEAVNEKTKAILVVHLLGFPANMDAIMDIARKNNLVVVEDCAQAPGTKYKGRFVGTIGDIGVFSFQETKNIMTGEGGMILTDRPELAKRCRLIRNHGESIPDETWQDEDLVNIVGMNFRMTELTAAVGVAQLRKLDDNNRARKENANYLIHSLRGLKGLEVVTFSEEWVPHILPLLYEESATGISREKVLLALRAEGIPVGSGYPRLMNENPVFQRKIAYGKNGCPWSCHIYGGNPSYERAKYPIATELLKKNFIWFYHIHRNNTKEMAAVVEAFQKVFGNMEALRTYEGDTPKLGYKW